MSSSLSSPHSLSSMSLLHRSPTLLARILNILSSTARATTAVAIPELRRKNSWNTTRRMPSGYWSIAIRSSHTCEKPDCAIIYTTRYPYNMTTLILDPAYISYSPRNSWRGEQKPDAPLIFANQRRIVVVVPILANSPPSRSVVQLAQFDFQPGELVCVVRYWLRRRARGEMVIPR